MPDDANDVLLHQHDPQLREGEGVKLRKEMLRCAVLNTSMLKVVVNEEKIPEGHLGVFG